MTLKNFLATCWLWLLFVCPLAARGQEGLLAHPAAWLAGDSSILRGGAASGGASLNPAEETACPDGSCGSCSRCCRRYGFWGSVEYLMWWARGTSLPPLVTTSVDGTPQSDAGVLGLPSTSILFGDQLGAGKLQSGGRVTFGLWLDEDHDVTVAGRFFGLGGDTTRFSQASTGSPILAQPFFNALLGQQDALIVAYPGYAIGGINARVSTDNILSAEAFTEIMMSRDSLRRVDLVAGYQFFRLDDWLQVNSSSTIVQSGNPFEGFRVDVRDRFSTRNQFHGGEIGLRGRWARGQWSLNVLGQVALGNMNQQVTIAGTTTVTTPGGGSAVNPGGLLAAPSNIGTYQRDKFAYIPQLIANVHYHVNPCLSFHIGYNILWISDIALSGDQIDLGVNGSFPNAGPARPAFTFRDREYWLQGINFGLNWDF